jgi:shikimate kinase
VLPNIVLIGFMGCGKSSVGRRIAGKTGHRFVDTDELITSKGGRSITQIFAEHGEAHFRELESAALRELEGKTGMVLATGGGLILREENRAVLRRIGPVVWLDAGPDILFERVSRNRKRPLLHTEDPRASFDALLTERRPIYEAAADLRLDSSQLSHDDAARIVIEKAQALTLDQARPGFDS